MRSWPSTCRPLRVLARRPLPRLSAEGVDGKDLKRQSSAEQLGGNSSLANKVRSKLQPRRGRARRGQDCKSEGARIHGHPPSGAKRLTTNVGKRGLPNFGPHRSRQVFFRERWGQRDAGASQSSKPLGPLPPDIPPGGVYPKGFTLKSGSTRRGADQPARLSGGRPRLGASAMLLSDGTRAYQQIAWSRIS